MKKIFALFAFAGLILAGCEDSNDDGTVEQYAGNQVKVKAPEESIPAAGGTYVIKVATDVPIEVSIPRVDRSWLSAEVQQDAGTEMWEEGMGESITISERAYSLVTFTASANTGLARYSSVALIDSETKYSVYRLDIRQDGTEVDVVKKAFRVEPVSIEVEAAATSATVTVTAEVAWTVTSSNPAVVPSPASGSGNGTVTLAFPANTVATPVNATITIATTDPDVVVDSYEISFVQAAATVVKPAEKPAPGVLAEWYFKTENLSALNPHFNEQVADETADVAGSGGLYVEPNVSGKGRLECYNGIADKSTVADKPHKRCKRAVGQYGEPCWYGTWPGDYILWTAEADAPLAATTKLRLFFTLRPNNEAVMKYWLVEYLDGETWKPAGETTTKGDFTYNLELFFGVDQIQAYVNPEWTDKQINTRIDRTVTLSSDTPKAQFRITCVSNIGADGNPVSQLAGSYVLRFAGESTNANTPQYSETEHPRIEVVE